MADYYSRNNQLTPDHPNYDPTPGRAVMGPGRHVDRNDFIQYGRVGSVGRAQRAGELEQMLMDQSMGRGPSLADAHLRMAGDQAMAQQQSLAAGARPGMGGMAQRMAAQNIGRIGANIAQQSVAARLQEQLQARAALAQMLAQQRQLDLAQAGTEKKPGWEQDAYRIGGMALPVAATMFGGPAAGAATAGAVGALNQQGPPGRPAPTYPTHTPYGG